jgi:MoaA/NifB/PqqE/SkfB family radical SAM enzyme
MSCIVRGVEEAYQEIAQRTEPLPRVLWIELTSRCPYDCIFCSRKLLRGVGQHMDFAMYSSLISQLRNPEIIRLNYSGESIHHPRLTECCRLAAETGAAVELVTVLSALPVAKLELLARSGLTRMTVSIHTLDPDQFAQIYGFSSLQELKSRVEGLVQLAAQAPRGLVIDFAFVAMRRNIDQLMPLVRYAASLGIGNVCVHPVIRRDPITETFAEELEDGRLRPDFNVLLSQRIDEARKSEPGVSIEISTPELASVLPLSGSPTYYPYELPAGALIHDCDQDPWKTAHILSDGRVVSCEVRDTTVLGCLATSTLQQIWHGQRYREFRMQHASGLDHKCRSCVYKRAYLPGPLPKVIRPGIEGDVGLIAGWHAAEPGLAWSGRRGLLRMASGKCGKLLLRLALPPSSTGATRLVVELDDLSIATVVHAGPELRQVEIAHVVSSEGPVWISLTVDRCYRPSESSDSADCRELGVALMEARMS